MEVKGRINQVLPVSSGTSKAGNEWKKQEFVLQTDEQYSKTICFTLFGDKISMLSGLQPGSEVTVSFDVESREFSGRWYHNINAWKIDTAAQSPQGPKAPEYSAGDIPPEPVESDDLPF